MESDVNARAFNLTSRVLLAAAAVVVIAVLARDLHVVRLQETGPSVIDYAAHPSDRVLHEAVGKLERATAESPDTQPLETLSLLYYTAARPRTAIRYLTQIVRREPANLVAWNSLALAASRVDRGLYVSAVRHLRALSPIAPPVTAPRLFSRRGPDYR